jgi:RNA polymerase sigma-70 factor (ECF subfamily)
VASRPDATRASETPRAESLTADERLLGRLRAGESAAFDELVRAEGPKLLAVCRRLLANEDDAQDAVQDAFLSAFKALGGFEGGSKLSTWMHRIAINAALMKRRARRRRPELSIEELLPRFLDDGHHAEPPVPWSRSSLRGDPGAEAGREIEREETRRQVLACIDRLPENYRSVLLLRDIEELDTEETARALGMTANAVKVRLHRAHQALRTLLDPHFRRGGEAAPC